MISCVVKSAVSAIGQDWVCVEQQEHLSISSPTGDLSLLTTLVIYSNICIANLTTRCLCYTITISVDSQGDTSDTYTVRLHFQQEFN